MENVWILVTLLLLSCLPVFLLRLLFRRAKWKFISTHSTALAIALTTAGVLSAGLTVITFEAGRDGSQSPIGMPAPDPVAAALEDEVRHLQQGKLAYDVPSKMMEGRQEQIEVRITRGIALDVENLLKQKLRGSAQVESIQVAPFMTVELHDADGSTFKIVPLTQDRQPVAGDGYTRWAWIVTPLQSGPQTLFLSVGTRFKLPNHDEETRFKPVYEKNITVQVDHMFEAKHFLSTNWQWLTATLIIPLVGFLWHRKKTPKQTELLP